MIINTEVCTNCGLCLSVCPVYRLTLNERFSPRGKINIYNYCHESKIYYDDSIVEAFDRCLLCGRCQKVCPAGINIVSIILDFKNKVSKRGTLSYSLLSSILKKPFLLNSILGLLSIRDLRLSIKNFLKLNTENRIFIFAGCYYKTIGRINLKILLNSSKATFHSDREVCCGLPLLGTGNDNKVYEMIKWNLALISRISPDVILTLCDSCYFVIKNIWKDFIKDNTYSILLSKVKRLTDYLNFDNKEIGQLKLKKKIYYHKSCHDLGNFSIEKLEKGLDREIIRLPDSCCGFGGFFSIKYRDDSRLILSKLIKDIRFSEGDVVLTTCSGCQYQLRKYLRKKGVKVIHPLSLATCY